MTLVGSVELEIALALLIAIQEIPVGGPVIGTSLGTIIGVDPIAGVDVDGEVEIVGGWAFPGLDRFPDIPDDLLRLHPLVQFDIPTPGDPFAVGAAPTRWSRLFDIDSDDGAAAVLPDDTGVTVVEDRGHPWLASLDGAGVPIRQSTAADVWNPVTMVQAVDGDLIVAGADQTTCVAVVPRSSGGVR